VDNQQPTHVSSLSSFQSNLPWRMCSGLNILFIIWRLPR
jgi:hypothetical protein